MDARLDGGQAMKLAVVEILDRDGHARQAVPVRRWPVIIGRAIDCDVVLDDPHVAAHHATLADVDGTLGLQVGDSVNGARLPNRHVAAFQSGDLASGEVFQLGGTRLRVRRASDALPPERALVPEPTGGRVPLTVLVLALSAWNLAERWLNADPGARFTEYLPVLFGPPIMLVVWCGLWALGSKLFRHRFDFWPHARIALSYLLVLAVTALMLPVAAYALGWAFPSRVTGIASGAVLWAMVLAHVTLILPSRRRLLAMGMVAVFAVAVAVIVSRNYQVNDRFFDELYVTTLAPPALRLAPAVTTTRFIDEARELKAVLDAHAADDDNSEPDHDMWAGQ